MTKEEIDNEADKHLIALQSMEAAGIIKHITRKALSGKVKAWAYDREKEIPRLDRG